MPMRLIVHTIDRPVAAFSIESDGKELLYQMITLESRLDDEPEIIHPSDEQWDRFWSFMQECDGWAEKYKQPDTNVCTSWFVSAENGDLSILSSGSNDIPENFQTFLNEVRLLIGGREFRVDGIVESPR